MHRLNTLLTCAFLLLSVVTGTQAQTRVIAATDSWDQLLYLDEHQVPRGPIADFIGRMNAVQDKFRFELVIYPRLRVDAAFKAKQADVYPLRTMSWVGPELGLLPTKTILSSGDVYFALRSNRAGGHAVFDKLRQRTLVGVRGYHYQLFNNNPDEALIKRNFNAYLLSSNEAVVKFILAGQADVGIVPEAILAGYLADPKLRDQLIVSDTYDSMVELSNLVRKDGPVSVDEMNAIVDLLVKSGDVRRLKAKLNIERTRALKK